MVPIIGGVLCLLLVPVRYSVFSIVRSHAIDASVITPLSATPIPDPTNFEDIVTGIAVHIDITRFG